MIEKAFRLRYGDDLKRKLEESCPDATAVILSGVGCLFRYRVRLAKAVDCLEKEEDVEIVSLTGTISHGQAHAHIALSDERGDVKGGHLMEGCLVNTTCEVVLGILENYGSVREHDPDTGYDEIVFQEKKI